MIEEPDLVKIDPLLKPFRQILSRRHQSAVLRMLDLTDGRPLKDVVNHHLYYGLHFEDNEWVFREKAPAARQLFLIGDFSYWQVSQQYELHSIGNGDWEIRLPYNFLKHGMLYKLWMVWQGGAGERIPSCATRVVQNDETKIFSAQVWCPENAYTFNYSSPSKPSHPLIYEAHIGMSSEKEGVATYNSFREEVLPRIKALGYNTIQLMAVQEHPYYGSFGYQVANLFAPSSRFGTPDELKALIDEAHHHQMNVILDVVHSHAVSNEIEGLSHFDGSETLYFHGGERGKHPVWDSRCYNYGKSETILLLLSNLKYWLEEFHFDGFRFDGVTSACYFNHGIGVDFVDYKQYFDDNVDEDAIVYFTLANKLIKELNANALSIAEDVSGMPGMAFPVERGGIGFDYRMSMGIADFWVKLIKEKSDEYWSVGEMFFRMTDHRAEEKNISYVESHDQAMVGDKTLIFRLIDRYMYDSMSVFTPCLQVDRGVALHKMIRLITFSLCDGGYLNFMGNEFGHPEWIDFPREGNGWSYHYARRQWSLCDNETLKYHALKQFDVVMLSLTQNNDFLSSLPRRSCCNEADQVLAYQRGKYIFVYNFSPDKSYTDYEIPCELVDYEIVLNTDDPQFAGFGNVDNHQRFIPIRRGQTNYIRLYLPARTALALKEFRP